MKRDDADQSCKGKSVLSPDLRKWKPRWEYAFQSILLCWFLWSLILARKSIQHRIWLSFWKVFAHKCSQFRKSPACQREFLGFDKRSSDRYFYTRSLQVVKCRSKLNALLKKVSQLGQRKDWKTALMFTTQHIWLLYLNSSTVLSYFCRLRLASSQIMFPSTKSMSYSRILSVSRISAVGIEAVGLSAVHVDSLELIGTVSILFIYQELKILDVSSSSRWFPCQ